MAEDNKSKKVEEIEVVTSVPIVLQKYKVKKDFTFDKPYKVGNHIELSDQKIIDKLTSNKFI